MYLVAKGPLSYRKTPVGVFLLTGDKGRIEIDDTVVTVLGLCDGRHTPDEVVLAALGEDASASDKATLDALFQSMEAEGVIVRESAPRPVEPFYRKDRPLAMMVEITYACNEACLYCLRPTGKKMSGELENSVFLDLAEEAASLGVSPVNITGGEPLLKADLALEMSRRLHGAGCHVHLLTNGLLVTPALARELHDAGVESAQVSLDSANPETHDRLRGQAGAHARALQGIADLRGAGIVVNTATVVNRHNWEERHEVWALVRKVADWCKLSAQLPIGRGRNADLLSVKEDVDLHLMLMRDQDGRLRSAFIPRDRCSIGTSPVMAPDGTIYPCMLSRYEGLELGRYPQDSLSGIWKHSPLLADLRSLNVNELDRCRECEGRYFCGGGCRASAYASTGSYRGRDPVRCPINKVLFRALLREGDEVSLALARRCLDAAAQPE